MQAAELVEMRSASAAVSVVVPSFNHAPFLERCLRSVFGQTLPPAQLLVIDDGSRDGSAQVAERVLRDCPFPAELVVRPNRGLCATLNEGLAGTSGEFFAYLGSDDCWLPRRLERGVAALRDRPGAVAAYSHAYVIDAHDRITGCTADWAQYVDGDLFPHLMRAESVPLSPTVLYRRNIIESVGWDESSRLEDFETYLRVSRHGEFAHIAEPLGCWRRHGHNTSRNVQMMLDEIAGAQRRVAREAGWPEAEIDVGQRAIRFRFGAYFLMSGDRALALAMTLRNLAGAPSAGVALRRTARLLLPLPLLAWRDRRLGRRSHRRYGSLTDVTAR